MDCHGCVLKPAVQWALGCEDRVTGELMPLALTEHPADEFIARAQTSDASPTHLFDWLQKITSQNRESSYNGTIWFWFGYFWETTNVFTSINLSKTARCLVYLWDNLIKTFCKGCFRLCFSEPKRNVVRPVMVHLTNVKQFVKDS